MEGGREGGRKKEVGKRRRGSKGMDGRRSIQDGNEDECKRIVTRWDWW